MDTMQRNFLVIKILRVSMFPLIGRNCSFWLRRNIRLDLIYWDLIIATAFLCILFFFVILSRFKAPNMTQRANM